MKIAVIGLGCWGLVLTKLLTDNFETVYGWSRKEDLSKELLTTGKTSVPFEIELDKKVKITSNMKEAIENADVILLVVSTSAITCSTSETSSARTVMVGSMELPNRYFSAVV